MNFIYHLFLGRFALNFSLVFMLCDYLYQSCSEIGLAVYTSPFILLLLTCHAFLCLSFNTYFWPNWNEKHLLLQHSTKIYKVYHQYYVPAILFSTFNSQVLS